MWLERRKQASVRSQTDSKQRATVSVSVFVSASMSWMPSDKTSNLPKFPPYGNMACEYCLMGRHKNQRRRTPSYFWAARVAGVHLRISRISPHRVNWCLLCRNLCWAASAIAAALVFSFATALISRWLSKTEMWHVNHACLVSARYIRSSPMMDVWASLFYLLPVVTYDRVPCSRKLRICIKISNIYLLSPVLETARATVLFVGCL